MTPEHKSLVFDAVNAAVSDGIRKRTLSERQVASFLQDVRTRVDELASVGRIGEGTYVVDVMVGRERCGITVHVQTDLFGSMTSVVTSHDLQELLVAAQRGL